MSNSRPIEPAVYRDLRPQRSPCRRRVGSSAGRNFLVMLVLGAFTLPSGVLASQKKSYSFEEDPIRNGTKALEERRLDDARKYFEEAVADEYHVSEAKWGLAEIAVAQGREDEGERLCRESLADHQKEAGDDRFAEAHARLGLILIRSGRWEEGAAEIRLAHRQKQNYWPANYGMARLLLQEEQWDEAKKFLDRGAKRKGLWEGEDLYNAGMALYYIGKGDLKSAEVSALNAFNMNLADSENGRLLGLVYEKRNVPALAIDAYEKVLQSPGVTPTAQFMHVLGLLYQKDGRYNEARDRYVKAVEIDSTYAPALRDLAGLLRSAKQYDKAAKIYLRYLDHEPGDLNAMTGLIESCLEAGYNAQALTSATQAMALDSTMVEVRLLYARAGLRSKDKAIQTRAAGIFATLPDSVGLKPQDYLLVGTQQLGDSRYEEAKMNLERAVAADSTLAEAHFQLGLVDLHTQDPDSAIVHFDRAIRLAPKVPLYYVNLGVAHSQAKRFDKAIDAYQAAVDLDNRLVISHLLLAEALLSNNNVDAAEAAYRKALEIEPQNARGLRGLGFISLRKGQYPEAVRFYKTATQSDPGSADSWAGLGQAYLGMQDLAMAGEALRKAQSIDPNNATVKKSLELLRGRSPSGGG